MKVLFDNPHMTLWVASMRKLLHVTILTSDEQEEDRLCRKGKVMLYAKLGDFHALGPRYQISQSVPSSRCSNARPYLPFYIRSRGLFFQVSGVFDTQVAANQHMETRDDVGLIATVGDLHFIASLKPSHP